MSDVPGGLSTTVRVGDRVASASLVIDAAGDEDWFQTDLLSGQSYEVSVSGMVRIVGGESLGVPAVGVHDATGARLFYDPNPDGAPSARLSFTVPQDGRYYLSVSGVGDSVGGYLLDGPPPRQRVYDGPRPFDGVAPPFDAVQVIRRDWDSNAFDYISADVAQNDLVFLEDYAVGATGGGGDDIIVISGSPGLRDSQGRGQPFVFGGPGADLFVFNEPVSTRLAALSEDGDRILILSPTPDAVEIDQTFTPLYDRYRISLGDGRSFTIEADAGDLIREGVFFVAGSIDLPFEFRDRFAMAEGPGGAAPSTPGGALTRVEGGYGGARGTDRALFVGPAEIGAGLGLGADVAVLASRGGGDLSLGATNARAPDSVYAPDGTRIVLPGQDAEVDNARDVVVVTPAASGRFTISWADVNDTVVIQGFPDIPDYDALRERAYETADGAFELRLREDLTVVLPQLYTLDFQGPNADFAVRVETPWRAEQFHVAAADAVVAVGADGAGPSSAPSEGWDILRGGPAADALWAYGGDDELYGGEGDDWLVGGWGADAHDGGPGRDWLNFNVATEGVQVDLARGVGEGGEAAGDTYLAVENVTATNFSDGIGGDDAGNDIYGWWGADWAWGRGGVDRLNGGGDGDWLDGGADGDALGGDQGNDNLIGGLGDDWMWGGADSDAFWIDLASLEDGGHDRIMDFQDGGPAATDWIRFEGVRYDQIVWYEQGTSAVIQVALDDGGSHYVEIMNFTLAQLADQYYGHG